MARITVERVAEYLARGEMVVMQKSPAPQHSAPFPCGPPRPSETWMLRVASASLRQTVSGEKNDDFEQVGVAVRSNAPIIAQLHRCPRPILHRQDAVRRILVSQRLVTFDGAGSLSGSGYRVQAVDVAKSPISGTYSVQPDCSVSFEITVFREDGSVVHVDQVFGVVTESGLRVHGALVSTVAPATLTVQFEKVSQRLLSKSGPSD